MEPMRAKRYFAYVPGVFELLGDLDEELIGQAVKRHGCVTLAA